MRYIYHVRAELYVQNFNFWTYNIRETLYCDLSKWILPFYCMFDTLKIQELQINKLNDRCIQRITLAYDLGRYNLDTFLFAYESVEKKNNLHYC